MTLFRALAVATIVAIGAAPAVAQGKSGAARGKTTQAPKGGTTVQAPVTTAGGATQSGTTAKTNGRGQGAAKRATGSAGSSSTSSATGTTATTSTGTTTSSPSAPTPAAPNAISTRLAANPEQLARIKPMLPAGMTLEQATAGFRNQGQFLAALNASRNNGINFADVQKAMTVDGLSLGQATRQLRNAPPAPTTPTTPPASGTTPTTGTTPGTGTTAPTTGTTQPKP